MPPYRLDLTVSVLRRLATNVVDVLAADGAYHRALDAPGGPVVIRAAQVHEDRLIVTLDGPVEAHAAALASTRRILGADRDIEPFQRAASRLPWLRALVRRMSGVKPPRYPTLWEACVNAVVFQQVSLAAASTIARRLILALGTPVDAAGVPLYVFPGPERFLAACDDELRVEGLSAAKLATLRRCAEAITAGALGDAALEELPSEDAAARLRAIKGIGPWTAAVILLRGFGRLDVFPMNDTSVARNLALVTSAVPRDIPRMLRTLAPQQGMLYYYLLLARLEARGALGEADRAVPLTRQRSHA